MIASSRIIFADGPWKQGRRDLESLVDSWLSRRRSKIALPLLAVKSEQAENGSRTYLQNFEC